MSFNKLFPVSREVFSYNALSKTLVTEISNFDSEFRFDQLYDDACDVGLAVPTRDGCGVVYFFVAGEVRDAEGDIGMWNLEPCTESVRKHPTVEGVKMIVFND